MNTLNDNENDDVDVLEKSSSPDELAAPEKLGVYERPERRGLSPTLLIILLILALLVAYLLWQFVF